MKPKTKIKILEAELKGMNILNAINLEERNKRRIEINKDIEALKLCDKFNIPIKLIKAKDTQHIIKSSELISYKDILDLFIEVFGEIVRKIKDQKPKEQLISELDPEQIYDVTATAYMLTLRKNGKNYRKLYISPEYAKLYNMDGSPIGEIEY